MEGIKSCTQILLMSRHGTLLNKMKPRPPVRTLDGNTHNGEHPLNDVVPYPLQDSLFPWYPLQMNMATFTLMGKLISFKHLSPSPQLR